MTPLHQNTPLLYSQPLSDPLGSSVWLKMDALQPTGSFKIRGIGHACQSHVQNGAKRFISSSGGNAGIAAAYAGAQLGIPVLVFVPETTTQRALALIECHGAQTTVIGASWQEANDAAQAALRKGDAYLHPFDDPLLWQGHASIIDEVAATGLVPDIVVTAVGGGGLLSGLAQGMKTHGWADSSLVAVETTGTASFAAAQTNNRPVELPAIESIATSLGARQICQQAFSVSTTRPIESVVVSDRDAVAGCRLLLDSHQVLVEPACGAAIAGLSRANLGDAKTILVEVCGGVTSDLEFLQQQPGWHQ
ncbi:MAG: L-serine/L-threonine ammonia-lyase [Limisphaerales bacterium]|jgi:L-serine/L-threonine ammonia-lyase